MIQKEISTSDKLALERTKLANERTFLAYFRTFMVFLGSGIAILNIGVLDTLSMLGYFFMIAAIIIQLVGIVRFFHVKGRINKFYSEPS